MQFLLTSEGSSRLKHKLSKYRHYDSLLLHSLTIALLFFVLFQQQQLKIHLQQQSLEQAVEEIVGEKIGIVLKQLEEMRGWIGEETSRGRDRIIELRELIRKIGRELGLASIAMQKEDERSSRSTQMMFEAEESYEVNQVEEGEEEFNSQPQEPSQFVEQFYQQQIEEVQDKKRQSRSIQVSSHPLALYQGKTCPLLGHAHYPVLWRQRVNYSSSFILSPAEESPPESFLLIELKSLLSMVLTAVGVVVVLAALMVMLAVCRKSKKGREVWRMLVGEENAKKKPQSTHSKPTKILFKC